MDNKPIKMILEIESNEYGKVEHFAKTFASYLEDGYFSRMHDAKIWRIQILDEEGCLLETVVLDEHHMGS